MLILAFIPYLLSVCATITIKLATKLSDHFYLNSAVTMTSKFQGQMICCLCLKDAWPDLHETKSSVNKFVDLLHILPCPLTLCVTLTMNVQGQILKVPYLWNIGTGRKKWNKRGRIIMMVWYFVNNIWPTFYFHRMLQCRSGVAFMSLGTSLWAYPCRNGDELVACEKTYKMT